jgi:hypothetical protein
VIRWLVPVLDALVEGAWIAVVDALFAVISGSAPLGPFPFALAAGLSMAWTRRAGDRASAYVGLAVLYVGAFVGCGYLGGALAPGGSHVGPTGSIVDFAQVSALLGGLAVFRGSRHAEVIDDDLVVGFLLRIGIPLLALPWLVGAQFEEPARAAFAAAAFPATLLFVASGLLAMGVARLETLSAVSGVPWHTNRAWLALLGTVLGVMVLIAIPAAFLLGTPLVTAAAALMGPLATVLSPFAALFEIGIRFIFLLLTPIIDFLLAAANRRQQDQPQPIGGTGPLVPPSAEQGEPSQAAVAILVVLGVIVGLVLFAVLLKLTRGPRRASDATPVGPLTEREFRLPTVTLRRPRVPLPRRNPQPTTASAAYVAFLADLAAVGSYSDLARRPDEPPATHAARLRAGGFAHPAADLLAADYALERYALREVTPAETRRALRRRERLRDLLRRARPTPARPA